MSSTDTNAQLRELFLKQLLPAAATDGEPRVFFPLGSEPGAVSYYVERKKPRMAREDFLISTADGSGDPIVALGELWASQGLDKLAALAPKLREAATALRQIEKPADDVSPFIYVMF